MGTSQSYRIKSTPNWAKTKRAMTHLAAPGNMSAANVGKFLGNFSRAVSESQTFGSAGTATAGSFIEFITDVRNLGWEQAILQIDAQVDVNHLTASEFMELLLKKCCENDSNLDDQAANIAFQVLEGEIQSELNTAEDIGTLIENATEEQILEWIGSFYVNYIMEIFGELYYTHLEERGVMPENVLDGLRDYVMSSVNELLINRPGDFNIFSQEGRDFINRILGDLNDLWEQSLE